MENTAKLGIFDYVKQTLTTNFANFSGRARRREYWLTYLGLCVVSFGFTILQVLSVQSAVLAIFVNVLSILWSLFVFIPSLALLVRRLHDINRSGWWVLLCLTGIGVFVILVFLFIGGTEGENDYGPDPKANNNLVAKP